MRFLCGHGSRLRPTAGYKQETDTGLGQVTHRVRAIRALGKPLPKGAEVHHVDGDTNSATARLVICQDRAFHQLLHRRARIVRAGGHPDHEKICSACKAIKARGDFPVCRRQPDGLMWYCKACAAAREARRRRLKAVS